MLFQNRKIHNLSDHWTYRRPPPPLTRPPPPPRDMLDAPREELERALLPLNPPPPPPKPLLLLRPLEPRERSRLPARSAPLRPPGLLLLLARSPLPPPRERSPAFRLLGGFPPCLLTWSRAPACRLESQSPRALPPYRFAV